ncbi:hypothetical protein AC579_6727 [Pseudocercospora musae]|uniref:Uncharacterized protein n=1 Tax=Pseudocercospora musae TaxID=113226 RepID=A0A139HW06_9PEZI|nr:hypothetical protein AC579_6727 [Pseudocercospora musae]
MTVYGIRFSGAVKLQSTQPMLESYITTQPAQSSATAASSSRPASTTTNMTTSIDKKLSLARAGLVPIDIPAYLGNHIANSHCILKLALTGAWAASLNTGRKGDATKLEALAHRIIGEADFDNATHEALAAGEKLDIVKAGFSRIDIQAIMGDQHDVHTDKEMLKKMLVGVWGALLNLRKMGDAQKVEEMAGWVFGQESWDKTVDDMLDEYMMRAMVKR